MTTQMTADVKPKPSNCQKGEKRLVLKLLMPQETSLALLRVEGEKENRGTEILKHQGVHGYMNRKQLQFATDFSADSTNYWQNELDSRGLLKVWKRPTARDQLETSITYAGESYLEQLGCPNHGYAKSFSPKKKPQRKHRLGITTASLAFLRAAEVLEEDAEVLPPRSLWVRSEEIEMDKIWLWGSEPYLVEYENSTKGTNGSLSGRERLEKKFQQYADCVTDGVFELYGLKGARVLYITPSAGRIPKLQEAAKKAGKNLLFLFMHEGAFIDDCRMLLREPIWRVADETQFADDSAFAEG